MQTFKITIDHRDFIVLCLPNRPKALLDRTVAEIYEVTTMRVNEAVKRNPEKFPEDFCFELTPEEVDRLYESENSDLKSEVIANCDNLGKSIDFKKLKYSPHLPKAFTHLGCNMLATVLKSPRAVQRAIQIIRTFTALESGGFTGIVEELRKGQERLEERLEKRMDLQDQHFTRLEERQSKVEESLHFLLWEGQSETSPIVQIHQRVRRIEEKIETIFMDGRFKRLQLQVIYGDIVKLREYIEEEQKESREKDKEMTGKIFHQEDRLSRIGHEIEKLEEKVSVLLKEKKTPLKELPPPPAVESRISVDQAETLRSLVHKKAKGKRKKIMEIWGEFKREFGVTRYKLLPKGQYEGALQWVRGR